jgi:hypothetical protein
MAISDDIKHVIEENKVIDKLKKYKNKSINYIKKHPKTTIAAIYIPFVIARQMFINKSREEEIKNSISNIPSTTKTISKHLDYHLPQEDIILLN